MAERLANQVDIELDGAGAFTLTTQDRIPVGYILKWKFASGAEFKADLEVPNPEKPTEKIKVVAVLDNRQFWIGGRTNPIEFKGRLSSFNRAQLSTLVNKSDGGAEQEVAWMIINYDADGKVYFKYFHTEEDAKVVFTPGKQCYVSSKACDIVTQPPNFIFNASFTGAALQKVYCAEDATQKTVPEFGGVAKA